MSIPIKNKIMAAKSKAKSSKDIKFYMNDDQLLYERLPVLELKKLICGTLMKQQIGLGNRPRYLVIN